MRYVAEFIQIRNSFSCMAGGLLPRLNSVVLSVSSERGPIRYDEGAHDSRGGGATCLTGPENPIINGLSAGRRGASLPIA
ncbi:hypothetical protein ACFWF3_23280, partial [Nocardia sp. NPDC060220]|uniref:hypothetical protein n=1 Tax=Nocardia sp. NPDC060220 TaxID=3347076 RepID=UPI00365212B8